MTPLSPIRRLLLAALIALLVLPLFGWAIGQTQAFAGIAIVLASIWLVMAAVGLARQKMDRRDV